MGKAGHDGTGVAVRLRVSSPSHVAHVALRHAFASCADLRPFGLRPGKPFGAAALGGAVSGLHRALRGHIGSANAGVSRINNVKLQLRSLGATAKERQDHFAEHFGERVSKPLIGLRLLLRGAMVDVTIDAERQWP